ncbi:DNA repair and recombination protein RadA [Candidatus Micrarchaeota archaeon]|nr:DNA repair and recombination protein RadA [Candidatus Micrarchaeota archaeon]
MADEETQKEKRVETIEDLQGISENILSKIKEAGYDIESVAASMPAELVEATGIGLNTAVKVIAAAKQAVEPSYEDGAVLLDRRKLIEKISTGSEELNQLLGGGIETQAITEAFGRFGSGKSQLGFQLCVNVQLPKDKGGLDGAALLIDSENTFRPERLAQMAQAKGLDADETLKRVFVARAKNSDHQILLVQKASELIKEKNIKIIVVDSLMSAFRNDYIGRGTLQVRQGRLNNHLHDLQRLAEQFNLAIYVTNQVMDRPDILFGDPTTPVGGNIVAHQSTYRMYFRRSKEDRRISKLVDSPSLPDGECVFTVSTDGIGDL